MPDEQLQRLRDVLARHCEQLLERRNVVATGLGYKLVDGQRSERLCIVCSVSRKLPRDALGAADTVPERLDDVVTDVVETGPIRAFQDRTGRQRPAPGGVSVGHPSVTAGTLGCVVERDGQRYMLSNNHVLANSNDAEVGDAILQPGVVDGGRLPEDRIALLHDFVPIRFPDVGSDCPLAGGTAALLNGFAGLLASGTRLRPVRVEVPTNLVDAAIAGPVGPEDVDARILELGEIAGVAEAELGTALRKSGRTTGLTRGRVEQVDVTVDVQYGPGLTARFRDQLLAGAMSQGGDSGSAVLDDGNRLVGLLFAGSDQTTVINRIEHVFSALGLSL